VRARRDRDDENIERRRPAIFSTGNAGRLIEEKVMVPEPDATRDLACRLDERLHGDLPASVPKADGRSVTMKVLNVMTPV